MPTSARYSLQPQRLFASLRVTEVSAAGGRYSEPEEGKVTSNQEGIYAVAECADNFSGQPQVRFPPSFVYKQKKSQTLNVWDFW